MMNDLRESARQSFFLAGGILEAQRIISFDTCRCERVRMDVAGLKVG